MDRCAIMVDAGYVYAAGGMLCCGTPSRGEFVLDARQFVDTLTDRVRTRLNHQVLRTYWYDGARDGIRTEEQQTVAGLDDVKLRLGRLNSHNQQKGVDALIYRDMITLAQHRAVKDVVLVSGDEDLHEAVRTVQDYGVRVVLVGITAARGFNQSRELVYEADRLWTLTKVEVERFFTRRAVPANLIETETIKQKAIRAAAEFGERWHDKANETEVLELLANRPRIPRILDVELLTAVEKATGTELRGQDRIKRDVRAAWWGVIGGGAQGDSSTRTPGEQLKELVRADLDGPSLVDELLAGRRTEAAAEDLP
jgi:uncharacterized LabA/DUF88 family protein